WLSENQDDPAFKDFLPKLKQHLLSWLHGHSAVGEKDKFLPAQLNQISFDQHCIYSHATTHFNYMTYNICHDQDNIHVGKIGQKQDIMVMSNDEDPDSHPFWYACILGIYHANVLDSIRSPLTITEHITEWTGGPSSLRLDCVGYVPENDPSGAFGFMDPSHILHACHLEPAFHLGRTNTLLPPSKF
ncbi:hypothetical protein F5146DRAFT_938727, partial [Armillaria mellea]